MTRRTGRARVGCLGAVLIAAAAIGAIWAFDAFVGAPWAHSVGGRPTLTGEWTGSFVEAVAPGGTVWLQIIRGSGAKRRGVPQTYDYSRLTGRPLFHGTAVWCRGDGSVSHYRLGGSASGAGDVSLTFVVTPTPTRTVNELHENRGHWSGADLQLAGTLQRFTVGPGRSTTTQPTTTVRTLTLHPATLGAADTACASAGVHQH